MRPPFGAFLLPSLPDFVSRTRKDDAIRPYLALPRKIIENKSLTIRSSVSAIYQRRSLPDSSYQFPNENWQTSFFFLPLLLLLPSIDRFDQSHRNGTYRNERTFVHALRHCTISAFKNFETKRTSDRPLRRPRTISPPWGGKEIRERAWSLIFLLFFFLSYLSVDKIRGKRGEGNGEWRNNEEEMEGRTREAWNGRVAARRRERKPRGWIELS